MHSAKDTKEVAEQEKLSQWMETEGERRLRKMVENPASALSHEQFWSRVEGEADAESNEDHSREAA